ncbi:unnamed protein product [Rhodiola kirilowii]
MKETRENEKAEEKSSEKWKKSDKENEKEDEEKEKKEDEVNDDDEKEDEENEEEEKEEPVMPNARPTRERKTVERYSVTSVIRSATPKSVSIQKGNGEKLSDIPNGMNPAIAFYLLFCI